jgi:predicted Zn-dependent protease
VVRNRTLFHTALDLALECPLNWRLLNRAQFVRCTSPDGEATIQLHILSNAGGVRLDDRLKDALGSVPMLEPHWDYVSGATVFTATALTNTAFGPRRTRFVVAEHAGGTYALALATGNPMGLSAAIPALEQVAASLQQLSPNDHEAVQPLRLALVRTDGTQNLETMASSVGADRTLARVLNASKLDARPPAGSLVKLA